MSHAPFWIAAWIFMIGLYGIVTSRHLIHLAICLGVVQTSTYVFLLGIGYRTGATAPIFLDIPPGTPAVDSVVQALMLTDIVVEATVIALLLALITRIHLKTGSVDPDDVRYLKG